MQSLISYLQTEKEFQGQASELVERLQLTIRGNVLARKLNRYEKELQDIGIEFFKSRTGQKRELLLVYSPPKAA